MDAAGTPLAAGVAPANENDVEHLLPLVDSIPPLRGRPGAPRRRPDRVYADRGYDSRRLREELRARGIASSIARRRTAHGSGLGRVRWVVERTFAWLHGFRRLLVRFDRLARVHEAFLRLACALVCRRRLGDGF